VDNHYKVDLHHDKMKTKNRSFTDFLQASE